MSTVQVALGVVEVVFGSPIPVPSTAMLATPKTLTSSTTAAKPAISLDEAALAVLVGGTPGLGTPFHHRRAVWIVSNSGTDLVYAIFGASLTAGNYTTSNADDYGHAILPGTSRQFAVGVSGEEVVIIQAA